MNRLKISVLRLNHRPTRDKRVSTHLFLAARAFGTDGVFYCGKQDEKIEKSIEKVSKSWGGTFKVKFTNDWKQLVKDWKQNSGEIIHLTMYGLPIQDVIEQLKASQKNKLIIVGGAKVPGVIYELADWNISVTSQPHSEVSALSVFLHELFEGRELLKNFNDAEKKIIPKAKGKKVVKMNM